MAAYLKDQFGSDSELTAGSRGIFDVYADDRLIFSKFSVDRFPEHDEIRKTIDNL